MKYLYFLIAAALCMHFIDVRLAHVIDRWTVPDDLLETLSLVGSIWTQLFIWCAVFVYAYFKKSPYSKLYLKALLSLVIAIGVVTFLKYSVGRARPFLLVQLSHQFKGLNFSSDYHSFPSAHVLGAMISTYWLTLRKWTIVPLAYAFTILIASCRILLSLHYLSDVIVSVALGFLILKLSFLRYQSKHTKTPRLRSMGATIK